MAKWILRDMDTLGGRAECLNCGFVGIFLVSQLEECPVCGAKMDGKDGE